jgi:hypothetical protein
MAIESLNVPTVMETIRQRLKELRMRDRWVYEGIYFFVGICE